MTDEEMLKQLLEGQKTLHVDQRAMEIKLKEILADVGMTKVTIDHYIKKRVDIIFDTIENQNKVNERILAALERIESKLNTKEV